MTVTVDVARQDGAVLPAVAATAHPDRTEVYDGLEREAEADVQRIIAANLGRVGVAASTARKPA